MKEVIEGLLYIQGDVGLSIKDLAMITELEQSEVKELVEDLQRDYEEYNRGLRIICLGNNYKMTTRKEDDIYISKLVQSETNKVLSNAALEVLAIVAYNEPITRGEIDNLRGVDSAYIIRRLIARDLLMESGKKDAPGKPTLYKTTTHFLDYFGLSSLAQLPEVTMPKEEEEESKDLFSSIYKDE